MFSDRLLWIFVPPLLFLLETLFSSSLLFFFFFSLLDFLVGTSRTKKNKERKKEKRDHTPASDGQNERRRDCREWRKVNEWHGMAWAWEGMGWAGLGWDGIVIFEIPL
ncbi:hypothetical protein HDK64DRAFT_81701 [Phyllosticta capitalensis]